MLTLFVAIHVCFYRQILERPMRYCPTTNYERNMTAGKPFLRIKEVNNIMPTPFAFSINSSIKVVVNSVVANACTFAMADQRYVGRRHCYRDARRGQRAAFTKKKTTIQIMLIEMIAYGESTVDIKNETLQRVWQTYRKTSAGQETLARERRMNLKSNQEILYTSQLESTTEALWQL